ncbi:MAG TPA: hypothetical protein VIT92_11470, partial [Burkholderiaceae bacterium]
MKLRHLLLAAGLALPLMAAAQPQPELAQYQGREKKKHADTNLVGKVLSAAEARQMTAQLRKMRDLMMAAPVIAGMRGYDWSTYTSIKPADEPGWPVIGRVGLIAFPYLKDHKTGQPVSSAEGPPFSIYVNDPSVLRLNTVYDVDEKARFMTEPRLTGRLDGYAVYENQFVVIARPGQILFAPVTQERFLKRLIEKSRAELKEMRGKLSSPADDKAANEREIAGLSANVARLRADAEKRWATMGEKFAQRVAGERAKFDEREKQQLEQIEQLKGSTPNQRFLAGFETKLKELEQELRDLPAADLNAPAYLPDGGKRVRASGLNAVNDANGRRVVTFHPQLFDAKKPKNAIQLIVLGTPRYGMQLYQPLQQ